jgi:hypothetical protein
VRSAVVRTAALGCGALAAAAYLWRPDRPEVALGIAGGALLTGLSAWAIAGVVDRVTARGETGEIRPVSWGFALVKFFTRHVILAVAAYGMMVRLQFDPVAMIVGVASAAVAAATAARRR